MTRDDYEQYEAAHPDGIKLDPSMFPKFLPDAGSLSDDAGNTGDEGDANRDDALHYQDNTFACPSTRLHHDIWAGDDNANPSPYKRPANPEPTTPSRHLNPNIYPTTPTSSDSTTASDASPIPTSPYRRRSTADSWTGLELTAWGHTTYLTPAGTMALHQIDEIDSGICHGILQRCTWAGYTDASSAPPSSGPELKLTTAEGEEWWLDDGCEEYTYEYVCEDQAYWGYGHQCGEACGEFYYHDHDQYQAEDDGGFWMEGGERDGELQEEERLETVPEEDEESEIEPVDGDLLDRLAEAVLAECVVRRAEAAPEPVGCGGEDAVLNEGTQGEKAGEKELPMWMRDPWHVSNMSWADMADEEEEW